MNRPSRPTLMLLGQRASVLLFAVFALAGALAWGSEWALGVLTPSDAVAYPLLIATGLVLGAVVRADASRTLLAQRIGVGAMALYLCATQAAWLLQPPQVSYALATLSPWILCTQLLIFTSWPAKVALRRAALLLLVLTLPPLLATRGPGLAAEAAQQSMAVIINAAMAQLCFGLVMYGLSRQLQTLMHLAPDGGGQHLTADELVALGTAERQRDQHAALAGQRAKSSFLAIVSHEMRTPLNVMLGGIDAVLREGVPAGQAALLRHARQAGDQLLQLVAQTLDFARLDDGLVVLDPQPVQVAELAQRSVQQAQRAASGAALQVGLEVLSPALQGATGWLLLDAGRLRQVLDALLGNAVRFTQAGSVTLRLQQHGGPEPRLRLEVRDTGIGMDLGGVAPAAATFEPFSQAADPLCRAQGGLGLGLALSQRLVRQMGGTLDIDSRIGAGTCVVVDLPLLRADMPQGWQPQPAGATVADPGTAAATAARRPVPEAWHRSQRHELLRLLADNDGAAVAAWNEQRQAWSGLLTAADLGGVERAIAAIDFETALALLQPHVGPGETSTAPADAARLA